MVLSRPELGLRIAVMLRLFMFICTPYGELKENVRNTKAWRQQLNKKELYDIRSSIGIGSKSDVLYDNGEAFVLSGHGLDALKSTRHTLDIDTCWPDINKQLKLNLEFIEMIMSRWTPVQGRIAAYHIMNISRKVIMLKNNISSSTVTHTLKTANIDLIERIIECTEDIIIAKLNSQNSI